MPDECDLLDGMLDDRLHALATDVRRHTAARVAEMSAPTSDPRWHGPLAIAAVVIVVIAGLMVVRGGDAQSPADPNSDLRWVIDGLPEGWSVIGVSGPGSRSFSTAALPYYDVVATEAAPGGRIAAFEGPWDTAASPVDAAGATDVVERTSDGRRWVFASRGDTRLAWVEDATQWRSLMTRGFTDDEIVRLVRSSQFDAGGLTDLGDNPFDLSVVARAAPITTLGRTLYEPLLGNDITDVASLTYTAGVEARLRLTVGRVGDGELAWLGLVMDDLTSIDVGVDHARGWRGALAGVDYVVWERKGLLFLLSGTPPPGADLAGLASSVRRVSEWEWSNLGAQRRTTGVEARPPGTEPIGVDNPADTVPRATLDTDVEPIDVDIDARIVATSAYAARYTAVLPTGDESSAEVFVVADFARVSAGPDLGFTTMRLPLPDPYAIQWYAHPGPNDRGVYLFTDGDEAASLVVTNSVGGRYHVPLLEMPGHPEYRFAALALPAAEFVRIEVRDADGSVLSSM